MKKMLVLLLVLGLASVASALPADDFEAPKVVGDLDGQGGGTGWATAWSSAGTTIDVVSEPGNQFWRYYSDATTDYSTRSFDPLAVGGQYTIYLKFRSNLKGGSWGTNTPSGVQLKNAATGKDPLHLKPNQTGQWMLNDSNVMHMDTIPNWYTTGGHTPAEIADYYMNYVDQWAPWKFDLDLAAATIKWYWMDNSGNWDLMASLGMGGAGDVSATAIDFLTLGGRANTADVTQDFDDFVIVPEPMTMVLLGLGGLALIRRKR